MRCRSALATIARRSGQSTLIAAVFLLATQMIVRADVTSDQPAAILVFPKIVVDITFSQIAPPAKIDTLIRVTNTSNTPISMKCFYVNATPHCADLSGSCLSSPITCSRPTDCVTQWQETDFFVKLTAGQPIAWLVSHGSAPCELDGGSDFPCLPLGGNAGSRIPPAPEDPFVGELKCIAVDNSSQPVERNDLKGEVEILRSSPASVDVEAYNALGIPAILGTSDGNDTLVLGGGVCTSGPRDQLPCATAAACPGGRCSAEYSGCPNILILDHFFDGATDPISGKKVFTDLTLVPCSEDFATQTPTTVTVQFLVFNEFESRYSTSRTITCFREFRISDIDRLFVSSTFNDRSIFSAAVNGTLTGQTRILGTGLRVPGYGQALLGLAEEFRQGGGSAAFNLHFQGTRPESDYIYLPQEP